MLREIVLMRRHVCACHCEVARAKVEMSALHYFTPIKVCGLSMLGARADFLQRLLLWDLVKL